MFEETSCTNLHCDKIFGRFRIVVVELLCTGGNFVVTASGTTPGIATTAGGATINLTGVPTGANYWFGGVPEDIVGSVTASITAQSATAGTMTLVASAATNGAIIKFFFLVNRTG